MDFCKYLNNYLTQLLPDLELLHKLLPHEIQKYVIESLETRLSSDEENITKLSDHRFVQVHRDVLKVLYQPSEDFAVYSSSCRLGSETMVLGQVCVRPSQAKVIQKDLEFALDMSLPKDPKGMVRRDIQEEKERQV